MPVVSLTAAKKAKATSERAFQNQEASFPTNGLLMRVARSLWPSKTDVSLSVVTGTSDRMCRYWLSNKYNISADDVAALLRGEDGFKFLEAIMGESRPLWWRDFKRATRRSELRRKQAELAKAIEENEHPELDL